MVAIRQPHPLLSPEDVVYPDWDGQPMAENTVQFGWIVMLQANLDALRPDDFVAGDLLWYPVEGRPEIRVAPDTLVVVGRPKGHRGSYIQHREGGVPPTVVFEVLSPGRPAAEMPRKGFFYQQYGVREFVLIDPDAEDGQAYVRNDGGNFAIVDTLDGWVSPTLAIRFAREDGRLVVYRPDGTRFKTPQEFEADATIARAAAAAAEQAAAAAEQAAATERARAERLAAQLRALGIDPDAAGA